VSEWQPIKTAPNEDGFVCIVFDGYVRIAERRHFALRYGGIGDEWRKHDGEYFCWYGGNEEGGSETTKPTHWMPLPEPPK
jgi:hypothetical protein